MDRRSSLYILHEV